MRDEIDKYRQAKVRPFGVNPAGIDSHRKYAEKFGFPFLLFSDPDRSVTASFGAVKDDGKRIRRSVVLVDHDGTVRFAAKGAPGADINLASLK